MGEISKYHCDSVPTFPPFKQQISSVDEINLINMVPMIKD